MNWDSTLTGEYWEVFKRKAIAGAIEHLKDFETDFSIPEQQQADWTTDQVTSAIFAGTDFMQRLQFPPRAMYDLMEQVPGILSRDPFGTTLQECFAYCAYMELQEQIDPAVTAYAEQRVAERKAAADVDSSSEPKAG